MVVKRAAGGSERYPDEQAEGERDADVFTGLGDTGPSGVVARATTVTWTVAGCPGSGRKDRRHMDEP